MLDQQKQVKLAEDHVTAARKEMLKKQQDVEKLNIHKEEWKKQIHYEILYKEGLESEEIGTSKYLSLKKERQRRDDYEDKKKKQ